MKKNPARLLKQKLPRPKSFANESRVLAVFLFGAQADGTATSRRRIARLCALLKTRARDARLIVMSRCFERAPRLRKMLKI
jgi:hypothetical protein